MSTPSIQFDACSQQEKALRSRDVCKIFNEGIPNAAQWTAWGWRNQRDADKKERQEHEFATLNFEEVYGQMYRMDRKSSTDKSACALICATNKYDKR